jgi:heme oxygenase
MIMQQLKQQTRPHHVRLEQRLHLPHAITSLDDYVYLLRRLYGFYAPVEQQLSDVLVDTLPELNLERRMKRSLIVQDLQTLGIQEQEITNLPRCCDLPAIPSIPHALGCLYVLEGATLGGQIIIRQLVSTLAISATGGGAFYSSYGNDVGPMWKSFCQVLQNVALSPAVEEAMVIAACDTFCQFERWMLDTADAFMPQHYHIVAR